MDYRLRQQGIVTKAQLADLGKVVQIGAGGIGSASALALGKMGVSLTVYDHDDLEVHNIGNQFLPENFLGQKKVHALKSLMESMAPDCELTAVPERWEGQEYGNVMIVTVDSMSARQEIWDSLFARGVDFFIDARMGSETLRVYAIDIGNPMDVDFYNKSLYPDEEAVQEPCTARGIIYTSMFAGAHIANIVKRLARLQPVKRETIHLIPNSLILG